MPYKKEKRMKRKMTPTSSTTTTTKKKKPTGGRSAKGAGGRRRPAAAADVDPSDWTLEDMRTNNWRLKAEMDERADDAKYQYVGEKKSSRKVPAAAAR